jgi:hypothetical protein
MILTDRGLVRASAMIISEPKLVTAGRTWRVSIPPWLAPIPPITGAFGETIAYPTRPRYGGAEDRRLTSRGCRPGTLNGDLKSGPLSWIRPDRGTPSRLHGRQDQAGGLPLGRNRPFATSEWPRRSTRQARDVHRSTTHRDRLCVLTGETVTMTLSIVFSDPW